MLRTSQAAFEGLLELGEVVGDEGQAVGGLQLIKKGALVVAELVAAGFDFDADKDAVVFAEADDIGDAAAALGVDVPADFGGFSVSSRHQPGAKPGATNKKSHSRYREWLLSAPSWARMLGGSGA